MIKPLPMVPPCGYFTAVLHLRRLRPASPSILLSHLSRYMRHLMPIVTPRLFLRPPTLGNLDSIQATKEDACSDLQRWMACILWSSRIVMFAPSHATLAISTMPAQPSVETAVREALASASLGSGQEYDPDAGLYAAACLSYHYNTGTVPHPARPELALNSVSCEERSSTTVSRGRTRTI